MHIPSLDDVAAFLRGFDELPDVVDDHIVVSSQDFCSVIYFASETVDHLIVRSFLRNRLEAQEVEVAAEAVTWSNSEFVGLTTLLEPAKDSSIAVHFRISLPIRAGLTTHQLHSFLEQAFTETRSAADHFMIQFPSLGRPAKSADQQLEQDREYARNIAGKSLITAHTPTTWADESRRLEELLVIDPELSAVTPKRIEHILKRWGPRNLEYQIHGSSLLTQLGGIRLSFVITAIAPNTDPHSFALVVEADWEPDLVPIGDSVRMFQICNDWNESSVSVKAACHTNGTEAIRVSVTNTILIRHGLGEAQLIGAVRVAIHNVLAAVDSLSIEATGNSMVHWPL